MEPALSPIWTDQAPREATQTLLLPRLPSITRRRSSIPPIWFHSFPEDRWDELLHGCLVTPCSERTWNAINRSFEDNREWAETIRGPAINSGAQLLPPEVTAPHRLPTRPIAVSLPHCLLRTGGRSKGPVEAAQIRSCSAGIGMALGPLPVCLAEYHQGKVRRSRLVLAALTHLTKAEIAGLREGSHLPGGPVLRDLVYGCAVDASLEPEWLVITHGQQPGHWRLLHNSFGGPRKKVQRRKLPALSTNAKHE